MTNTHLSAVTAKELTNRNITSVGKDYIELDNGLRIYLSEDEIKHLNNEY
jgi:hypothetical protein